MWNHWNNKIIETKQQSCHENISTACINLHVLEKSLLHISKNKSLKKNFYSYFKNFYCPTKHLLQKINNYNSQIAYLLCGFFHTQISYLLELLNNDEEPLTSVNLSSIEEKIIVFLETYAKIKPEIRQIDIKKSLLDKKILSMSFDEAKIYTIKNRWLGIL